MKMDATTIIIIVISISIGILGPILSLNLNKKIKYFLWFVFFIFLVANPIVNEYQASSSQSTINEMKSKEDVLVRNTETIIAIASSTQQTLAILAGNQEQSIVQNGNAVKSLKSTAMALSTQLIQFLNQRASAENLLIAQDGFSPNFMNEELSFEQDTLNMYNSQFSVQVIATTEALAQRGLTSLELRENYKYVVNTFGISTIAQQLGVLAEQLPN